MADILETIRFEFDNSGIAEAQRSLIALETAFEAANERFAMASKEAAGLASQYRSVTNFKIDNSGIAKLAQQSRDAASATRDLTRALKDRNAQLAKPVKVPTVPDRKAVPATATPKDGVSAAEVAQTNALVQALKNEDTARNSVVQRTYNQARARYLLGSATKDEIALVESLHKKYEARPKSINRQVFPEAYAKEYALRKAQIGEEDKLNQHRIRTAQKLHRDLQAQEKATFRIQQQTARQAEGLYDQLYASRARNGGKFHNNLQQKLLNELSGYAPKVDGLTAGSEEYIRQSKRMLAQQEVVRRAAMSEAATWSNTRYALYDVAQAYGALAIAAGAAAGAPVAAALSYEKAFAEVVRTADLAKDEVASFRDEFVRLSTLMPTSFGDLAKIGALGGQLGIAKEGLIDFTSVVGRLSETSDLTSEAAGTMIGRFAAINGVHSFEYEKLASAVLKVGVNSMATESDIAKVSLQISSMGKLAGMTAEQIVGLAGSMASVGIPPELSRSVITQVFSKIDKAVTEGGLALDNFAKLAGTSADKFKAAWGTGEFSSIFVDMLSGLKNAGGEGRAVLEELGIKSQRTVPSLLRMAQGVDVVKSSMADAASGWREGTELQNQYGVIADTTAAKLSMLKNTIMGVFAEAGKAPNAGLATFVDAARGLAEVFGLIVKIPIVRELTGVAVGVTAMVAAYAAWQGTKAMVIASELALRTALNGTSLAGQSMFGSLTNLIRGLSGSKIATDQDTVSANANAAARRNNATAISANAAAASGASGAIRGLAASSASATGTLTATGVAMTGLARAGGLAKTVMSALGTMFNPVTLAIGATTLGLSFLGNKIATMRDNAVAAEQDMKSLTNAILSDTAAAEKGTEAVSMFSKAWTEDNGKTVESFSTRTVAVNGSTTAAQLAAQAEDGLRQKIGETSSEIQSQTFYIGQNTVEFLKNKLMSEEVQGKIGGIAEKWRQMGDYAPMSMEEFFKSIASGGEQAKVTMDNLTASFASAGSDLAIILKNISGLSEGINVDSLGLASERAREFAESLVGLPLEEVIKRVTDYQNAMQVAADAVSAVRDRTSELVPDFEAVKEAIEGAGLSAEITKHIASGLGIELENTGNSALDAADKLGVMSQSTEMLEVTALNAMHNLGRSLANNGAVLDLYSQNGRANLSALAQAANAAAKASGGSAAELAERAKQIIQSLIAVGVQAQVAVAAVNNAMAPAARNAGISWQNIKPVQIQNFTSAVPRIKAYNNALREGFHAGRKSAAGSKRAGNAAKKAGNQAKTAAKKIRTLTDYVNDLSSVMRRASEYRFGHDKAVDKTAGAWQKLAEWSKKAQDAVDSAKKNMDDAAKSVRDARLELEEINAELNRLYADRDILEFKYRVAVEYGDALRANALKAELEKNSASINKKKTERTDTQQKIDLGLAEQTKASKDLAKAQAEMQRTLTGTTESAREQRDMVLSLIDTYRDQIKAYAETGASQEEVRAYAEKLRGEFIQQLLQLGYNRAEVGKYSAAFDDMITVINRIPRNITVSVDNNPAIRAINEYEARANAANRSAENGLNRVSGAANGTAGALGGVRFPNPPTGAYHGFADALSMIAARARDAFYAVRDFLRVNNNGNYRPSGRAMPGTYRYPSLLSKGGLVPGGPGASMIDWSTRGTDTVPAMLTPGEFVLRRDAVQALGRPFLNHLNSSRPSAPVTVPSIVSSRGHGLSVQLVELVPAQEHRIVAAAARQAQIRLSGRDIARVSTASNGMALQAGAN